MNKKDLIVEIIKNNPNITSPTELAKIALQSKVFISSNLETLRKYISKIKSKLETSKPIEEVKIQATEEEKWTVSEGNYHWTVSKDKSICFPVDFVDQLFYEYSQHGENLSQTEIINKHGFEVWQWESIKRKLMLVKLSNVFSPWTVANTPPDQLSDMMEEKMSKVIENPGSLIEKKYTKLITKKYKSIINQEQTKDFLMKSLLIDLADSFPKPKELQIPYMFTKTKIEHAMVAIADLHFGAKVEGLQVTRNYNSDIAREYLLQASERINEIGARHVTVSFLGDNIESLTGKNHSNSWQGMEWGVYGNRAIVNAFEGIEYFISKTNNIKNILGVGGNHDRMTADREDDVLSDVAGNLFYFLNRIYQDKINVEYHNAVLSKEIDNIQYILHHGHLGLSKGFKGDKMVLKYGNNRLFNLILTGHLHSRIIPKDCDTEQYRWLVCPSIFSGNTYSEQEGYSTAPGFLITRNNGKNKPEVLDCSL